MGSFGEMMDRSGDGKGGREERIDIGTYFAQVSGSLDDCYVVVGGTGYGYCCC